jgi:hypothetical protein
MRIALCRRRGPAPFWIGAAGIIAAMFLTNSPARAAGSNDAQDWHLYVGEAVVDTLDGSVSEILAAGHWVLLQDSWTIERKDEALGTLVTGWKPVRHPLLKLATGEARVRVAIALKSVGMGRTEIRVLGGIAAQSELKGPVLPLAQGAGQHECRGYVTELRARLAEERLSDGAPSASPRSTAEKR